MSGQDVMRLQADVVVYGGGPAGINAALATGQAAGTAAGLAVKHGCSPAEVDVAELQAELRRGGALLR